MVKTILWVEDEKDQFRAFSNSISKKYEIVRAVDYLSARSEIDKNAYDLYIIDIILPSGIIMNSREQIDRELPQISDTYYGIELIKYIREKKITTPILVVTVVAEQEKINCITSIDPDIKYILKYGATTDDVKKMVDELL
jgi:CheY-like chemotaxis protein